MWQALLPVAGQLLGGLFGNSSAKKASQAQQQGYQQGINAIGGYYNDAKGYMNPYMQTGTLANSGLQKLLSNDYSGFYGSPDFQAAMKAGGDMFDSSAAARGGVFGGGATRGREQYAQGLATQYLGNYRNWLGQTAGAGQQAATSLSGFGADAGNSIARLMGAAGEARASGIGQQGANTYNMLSGIGGALGGYFGGKAPPSGAPPIQPTYSGITPRTIGPYY